MDLSDTSKAIAMEAWSQLVHSIISDTPPSDMEPEYYYAFLVIEKSKLSKSYEYKLGTKNIQARMGSGMHPQVERAHEHEKQQEIDHIQDCTRSSKYSEMEQVNKEKNQQGIEHIQDCMRSTKLYDAVQAKEEVYKQGIEHIQECMRSTKVYDVVQAKEEDNKQGIEHVQYCMRSIKHCEVVQAKEHENQQGIEHIHDRMISAMQYEGVRDHEQGNQQGMECIQDNIRSPLLSKPGEYSKHRSINNIFRSMESTKQPDVLVAPNNEFQQWKKFMEAQSMSILFDELLDLVEHGRDLQGEKKLFLDPEVVCLIKLLHHYGVDTIRSGVAEELENLNQKHVDIEKDLETLETRYKKKSLEVMLRICDNKKCQDTIYQIIAKEGKGQGVYYYSSLFA